MQARKQLTMRSVVVASRTLQFQHVLLELVSELLAHVSNHMQDAVARLQAETSQHRPASLHADADCRHQRLGQVAV